MNNLIIFRGLGNHGAELACLKSAYNLPTLVMLRSVREQESEGRVRDTIREYHVDKHCGLDCAFLLSTRIQLPMFY